MYRSLVPTAFAASILLLAGACSQETQESAEETAERAGADIEANAEVVGEDLREGAIVAADEISEGAADLSENLSEEEAQEAETDDQLDGTD